MAHAWLAILTILACFKGCVAAPGDCGYVASTLVYPLGQLIGTTEIEQVVPGSAIATAIAPGHHALDYDAMWFSGPASSASLPMDDPVAFPGGTFPEDYGFQFVFYPEADGNVLRYRTDSPANLVDISMVNLALNGTTLYVTLQSQTNSDTLPVGPVVNKDQWHWVSVGRDGSRNVVFVRVNGTEYQLDFAAWTDGGVPTLTPGHFTVGAGFTGRLTCLHVIVCKSPEHVVDYFTECMTPEWPASLPNTTSTSPGPTSTSTTTTLTSTTVTTTSSSPTTVAATTTVAVTTTTATTTAATSTTTTSASVTPSTSAPSPGMRPATPPAHITEQCVAP